MARCEREDTVTGETGETGVYKAYYKSPVGLAEVVGAADGIVSVRFVDDDDVERGASSPDVDACIDQLDDYFAGRRESFSLHLRPGGTPFQRLVWAELAAIPFGRRATYRDIAIALGKEEAVRAVGHANGRNRINIIVPCHRVVGSDGKLRGCADGLWRKEWLLRHERAMA